MKIDHSILRLLSLVIAGLAIYLGYDLFIKGVTGKASLVLNSSTVSGQLLNAAPGLFFVLSGVAITMVSLYRRADEYKPMARVVGKERGSIKNRIEEAAETGGRVIVRRVTSPDGKGNTLELEIEDLSDIEYLDIPAFLRRSAD